jgi:hypothetical protein
MPKNKFNGYDYTMSLTIISTSIEWNATRWLAVVAKLQYRIRFRDNFDGSIVGKEDDSTFYAGIGLRWKITWLDNQ